jgi:hypothetical protein
VTERLLENVCTAQPSFIHKQQQQSSKAQQRLPSSKSPFQSLLLLLQRSLEPSRITFFLSSLDPFNLAFPFFFIIYFILSRARQQQRLIFALVFFHYQHAITKHRPCN